MDKQKILVKKDNEWKETYGFDEVNINDIVIFPDLNNIKWIVKSEPKPINKKNPIKYIEVKEVE